MIVALQSGLVLASKQPRAGSGINLSVSRCIKDNLDDEIRVG